MSLSVKPLNHVANILSLKPLTRAMVLESLYKQNHNGLITQDLLSKIRFIGITGVCLRKYLIAIFSEVLYPSLLPQIYIAPEAVLLKLYTKLTPG